MADINSWNYYGNTGGLAVKSKYLESSAGVAEDSPPTSETEEEENQQASPPAENPDDAGNYNP